MHAESCKTARTTPHASTTRGAIAATAVALAFALTACGGSGSSNVPGEPDAGDRQDGGVDAMPDAMLDLDQRFDMEAATFAEQVCEVGDVCYDDPASGCEQRLLMEMEEAKTALDDPGKLQCMACMEVMRTELQKLLAADCDFEAAGVSSDAILAACDLDPATDYLADDIPDFNEACAGQPSSPPAP